MLCLQISECGKQEDQLILLRGQLEMAQLNNQQVIAVHSGQVKGQWSLF